MHFWVDNVLFSPLPWKEPHKNYPVFEDLSLEMLRNGNECPGVEPITGWLVPVQEMAFSPHFCITTKKMLVFTYYAAFSCSLNSSQNAHFRADRR